MKRLSAVQIFEHECTAETFPPQLAWIEAQVESLLPSGDIPLQWAIVKTDPSSKRLWLEGAYLHYEERTEKLPSPIPR